MSKTPDLYPSGRTACPTTISVSNRCLPNSCDEFIRLFSPQIAERLISGTEEWLPQENFLDLFDGQKRTMDLVAKVSAREPILDERSDAGQSHHVIIDLEVESRSSLERLRPQAYEYYEFLRRRYRLPVLSLALLGR